MDVDAVVVVNVNVESVYVVIRTGMMRVVLRLIEKVSFSRTFTNNVEVLWVVRRNC